MKLSISRNWLGAVHCNVQWQAWLGAALYWHCPWGQGTITCISPAWEKIKIQNAKSNLYWMQLLHHHKAGNFFLNWAVVNQGWSVHIICSPLLSTHARHFHFFTQTLRRSAWCMELQCQPLLMVSEMSAGEVWQSFARWSPWPPINCRLCGALGAIRPPARMSHHTLSL